MPFKNFKTLPPLKKRLTLLHTNIALLLIMFFLAKITPLAFLLFIVFLVTGVVIGLNTFFCAYRHKQRWPALLGLALCGGSVFILFGMIHAYRVMGIC